MLVLRRTINQTFDRLCLVRLKDIRKITTDVQDTSHGYLFSHMFHATRFPARADPRLSHELFDGFLPA